MEENKNQVKPKKKVNILFFIIVLFVVVFLSVNVYATTNGFDNIFFMIKNMFKEEVETSGTELLSDREIIISYKSIEIMEGVKIQINKLTIENEKAKLHVTVNDEKYHTPILNSENEEETVKKITPFKYKVLNENDEVICEQNSDSTHVGSYTELLELKDVTVDTKILVLQMFTCDDEKIVEVNINLETKELEIVGVTEKIEKISEIELKEFLASVVRFNFFKDHGSITEYHTEEEYKNEVKVLNALEILNKKEAPQEKVYEVLEELFSQKIIEPYSVANIVVTAGDGTFKYVIPNMEHNVHAMCLDITNLSYLNGVYTAECVYIYPTADDYKNDNIENLQQFVATVKFKVNEDFKYTKYSILNPDEMQPNITTEEKEDNETTKIENTFMNVSITHYETDGQFIEDAKYTISNATTTDVIEPGASMSGLFLLSGKNTTQEYKMTIMVGEDEYVVVFKVKYDENNKIEKLWVEDDEENIVRWIESEYSGTQISLNIEMNLPGEFGWIDTIMPGLKFHHPKGWEFITINEEVEGLGTAIREFKSETEEVTLKVRVFDGTIRQGTVDEWVKEYQKLNTKAVLINDRCDSTEFGGFDWRCLIEEDNNIVKEYYIGRSGGFSDDANKAVNQIVEVTYENYEEMDRELFRSKLLTNMKSASR